MFIRVLLNPSHPFILISEPHSRLILEMSKFILFEDTFEVKEHGTDGKEQFNLSNVSPSARVCVTQLHIVTRISAHGENYKMDLVFDMHKKLYRLEIGRHL
jgi:hypothetical protein